MATTTPSRKSGQALDRHALGTRTIVAAALLLLIAAMASLSIGPTGISLMALPDALRSLSGVSSDADAERMRLVLIDLRLPRTLMGAFVGASLAVAGALMQGLFRNPLADPGLIGVSNGAALAAVAVIAFGNSFAAPWMHAFGVYGLPIAAFAGALAATLILVMVASRHGTLAIGTLLLAGIAIAAICGALVGLTQYTSSDRELRDITLWSLGSLSGASWQKVWAIAPFAVAITLVLPRLTRAMNGFLLGEAEAYHLGIDTEKAKRLVMLVTAAAVGAAVAIAGVIGFVGLVVPHVVRMVAGPDHRVVLPASALGGAALVLVADIVARMVVMPAELPIGIVMAAIGGPVFLHLVSKRGIGGLE
jgi:iron complex transport system permease protein